MTARERFWQARDDLRAAEEAFDHADANHIEAAIFRIEEKRRLMRNALIDARIEEMERATYGS